MKKYLALFILFLGASEIYAKEDKQLLDLDQFFSREIANFSEIMDAGNTKDDQSSAYYFSKVRLRLRAHVGLDVPLLAKLEVKPFIEFHFSQKR